MNNPIIDEVRAARAAISAEHGYDRAKILAWARAQQAATKLKDSKKTLITPADPAHSASKLIVKSPATKSKSTLGRA